MVSWAGSARRARPGRYHRARSRCRRRQWFVEARPAGFGIRADQADQPVVAAQAFVTGGDVLEEGAYRVRDLARGQTQVLQFLRIEAHLQLRVGQADGVDPVDTLQAFDGLAHIACLAAQVLVHARTDHGDRGRREATRTGDLEDLRVLGGGRQLILLVLDLAAQIGDPLVEGAVVDVLESDQDAGYRFAAVRGHELHVLDLAQCVFERVGHLFLDVHGRGPGQHRGDDDPVEVDGRVLLARQCQVGQGADDQHQDKGQIGENMVVEQPAVERHYGSLAGATLTAWPSVRLQRPSVISRVSAGRSTEAGWPSWACGILTNCACPSRRTNNPSLSWRLTR